jgi:hypothetical protein
MNKGEYTVDWKPFLDTSFYFFQASDAYLQMAIGNAPWPIGVTMVGIHARTGREKIFSKNVAHVMNDETQRKYLQGLKRLMTKCQQYFPTDPSRCVEYTRTELYSWLSHSYFFGHNSADLLPAASTAFIKAYL